MFAPCIVCSMLTGEEFRGLYVPLRGPMISCVICPPCRAILRTAPRLLERLEMKLLLEAAA